MLIFLPFFSHLFDRTRKEAKVEHKAFGYDRLLNILAADSPEQVKILRQISRWVDGGLLSVGIKLHILEPMTGVNWLVKELGGEHYAGYWRPYRRTDSVNCLVLPPMGSAAAAVLLLECLEVAMQEAIFNTPTVQIQICTPHRLNPRHAAVASMAFYLGSDVIRPYDLDDLTTTFSADKEWGLWRGKRLSIYDGEGKLDKGFPYWDLEADRLVVRPELPFEHERTDILTGMTRLDVMNVNFVVSVLVHAERVGWWEHVGTEFVTEFEELLKEHLLGHLLDVPWIVTEEDAKTRNDDAFFLGLQELMSYAFGEVERLNKPRNPLDYPGKREPKNILRETHLMLRRYRQRLEGEASTLGKKGGKA